MLTHLLIKNYALIDKLEIPFYPGFSVITGETGAGKSIILGAINLLSGQRADSRLIKDNKEKCVIEAHFNISKYNLENLFAENDIEYDAADCILRRELLPSGKSRAFINDTPVPLQTIKKISGQLLDIHSQHQNLLLSDEDFQLNVVDIIAQDSEQLDKYVLAYNNLCEVRKSIEDIKQKIEATKANEDFLRYQFNELSETGLTPDIQESMEAEAEKLNHVEDIKTAIGIASTAISDDNNGAVDSIREACKSIERISAIYPEISELHNRLENCFIEIKDISMELQGMEDSIEYDPNRLDKINEKLDRIYSLEHKHRVDNVTSLIEKMESIKNQLDNIDNSDVILEELLARENKAVEECTKHAAKLSSSRKQAAKIIETGMKERLIQLGIPNVRFRVDISQKDFTQRGTDRVAFMFSANKSSGMQPISQVASGGEIARVMLSLKAMISNAVKLPTIIFDEIDTGVSGKVADRMGLIMQEMGKCKRQVISITHLPQIAACGSTHYKVTKEETDTGTKSTMHKLTYRQRVEEIAQMVSGSDISDAAILNAEQLLNQRLSKNE